MDKKTKTAQGVIRKEITWGDRVLSFETGRIETQADSTIVASYGETVVLVTVGHALASEDLGYFPLSVEFEEKFYASGRISGSRFIKREGRPPESAILNGRLIDRSIRPLFPKDYFNQVQVIITVLSYDMENDPSNLGLIATSAALKSSSVPWNGPVASAQVGLIDGKFILNPTREQQEQSELELLVTFNRDKTVMIEAEAKEVPEKTVLEAIEFARKSVEPVFKMIDEWTKEVGKEDHSYDVKEINEDVKKDIVDFIKANFKEKLFTQERADRETSAKELREVIYEKFEGKLSKDEMGEIFEETVKKMVRAAIIDEGKRPDQRKPDQVRKIEVEVGLLPRTHGSALFKRGETHVLSVATLGSTSLEQLIDTMEGEETKRFMHHYYFPPFSTGEVRRMGTPGRREIGHGALAEKALVNVMPPTDKFPYTVRVVSEVMSSSGSTSMGSTCGSTLALMDAGVPIASPVSGIAMGLVTEGDKWEVLTDIQALEDFYGDMDFKIAGTEKGITAIQLDVKITGLTPEMVEKTFKDGKVGRDHILDKMLSVMPKVRESMSKYAPKVTVMHIAPKKIGTVIGSGGKTINKIIEDTGVEIDIEDDGTVMISGNDPAKAEEAMKIIEALTHEPKPGEQFKGTVKRIMPFGAFVEIMPGIEGLVHISQIAPYRVEDINKEVKVGQEMDVVIREVDEKGRVNLSRKFED
ncbi:MAG TPA: polyribonucleotide nucleotidyltransferase [Candidatus Saccharimonadales bacterium]|nr:polyribonucleotide nucleotidyltransferase [Candidatus Saccharimonadales bacterium]